MKSHGLMLAAVCAAGGLVSWLLTTDRGNPAAAQERAAPAVPAGQQPQGKGADDRPADRAAVLAAIDGLTKAFTKGDAKGLAAQWTPEGEYTSGDGTAVRGRAALEKAYAEFLGKNPGHQVEFEAGEVRFPSRDTAVAEGHMKLRRTKSGEVAVSRCSLLLAREDGKWLVVILREWPGDGHSLRELEFLIGTWAVKREGMEVRTDYEWTANKSFIRCRFSVTHDGKTSTGTQMIGKDPSTGALRVWTFEDDGGIGEAGMLRDGKKWLQAARGVLSDGTVLTATNILTPVDADSFTWQSVERTLDDEPQPDLPPVKVTRVKGKP